MTDADLRDATVCSPRPVPCWKVTWVLKSGRHAGRYPEKFLVLQATRRSA